MEPLRFRKKFNHSSLVYFRMRKIHAHFIIGTVITFMPEVHRKTFDETWFSNG